MLHELTSAGILRTPNTSISARDPPESATTFTPLAKRFDAAESEQAHGFHFEKIDHPPPDREPADRRRRGSADR
jgi:hypothetical protein